MQFGRFDWRVLMDKRQRLLDWLQAIIAFVLLALIIRSVIFIPVEVDGHSMYPTLEDGDRGVVNRFEPHVFGYERFDVVVFQATVQDTYVKRIIGMPGDEVVYQDDQLYINGEMIEEHYLNSLKQSLKDGQLLTENFTLEQLYQVRKVPEGHYFVLGDNRRGSTDSRSATVGFVSLQQIKGKLAFIVFPVENRKIVR